MISQDVTQVAKILVWYAGQAMHVGQNVEGDGSTTDDCTYTPRKPSDPFSGTNHKVMKVLSCIDNCTSCLLDLGVGAWYREVSERIDVEGQVRLPLSFEEVVNLLCVGSYNVGQLKEP
jgi:hypothetical protein